MKLVLIFITIFEILALSIAFAKLRKAAPLRKKPTYADTEGTEKD